MKISPRLGEAKAIPVLLIPLLCLIQAIGDAGGAEPFEAAKIEDTFIIIDAYGLRRPIGVLGTVLIETLSPTDPTTYEANVRGALKGKNAADAFFEFRKRRDFLEVEASFAEIDSVSLVGIEWLGPNATGFTFLVVGEDGPVGIEIQIYSAPKAKSSTVRINAIKVHPSWEDIRKILQEQLKLPAALTITGGFGSDGESGPRD